MQIKNQLYYRFEIIHPQLSLLVLFFLFSTGMRKTGNLLIRDTTKKSTRQGLPSLNSATSIIPRNDCKQNTDMQVRVRQDKKNSLLSVYHESQKELCKAENLSQQQQIQIQSQAKRTVTKKVKVSQSKIENDMVSMLEQECTKIGVQLQKQKLQNQKLRGQISILRTNIQNLNMKLQKIYADNSCLSKYQQEDKMENKQLAQKLAGYKEQLETKQGEVETLREQKENLRKMLGQQIEKLNETIQGLTNENTAIREMKKAVEEELQQKSTQAEYLRETFRQKKSEWQASIKQMEVQTKLNIEKKGEKITKAQSDSLKLQQKLKEQQVIRKKLVEKNKQLTSQISQIVESKRELEQTVTTLKKRVNDLSILKSTNSTILNQKINQLIEDNEKLRNQICTLQGVKKPIAQEQKPVLFGSNDFQ